MDTLRGQFDPADFSEELYDYDFAEEDGAPEEPPSAIGQDERRMQVRAYNHWAGLLGDSNFPSIEDLDPENLDDFGPYSVLLDFSNGIEDPHVQFVGGKLAEECDATQNIEQLSDVPSRSLLSRITDHYMQILANQAPIGFEAEFVNQRECTILYRGILLPYSSDNETIDFIFGVINWKEVADQQTTDELMLEIDQALDENSDVDKPEEETGKVLDLSGFNAENTAADAQPPAETHQPKATFGSLLNPEGYDEEDEDEDDFSLPADWRLSDPTAETDGDYADDSADVYDEDFDPETDDDDGESSELGLSRLIESEFERAEREDRKPIDLSALDISDESIDPDEPGPDTHEFARVEFGNEPADIEAFSSDEGENGEDDFVATSEDIAGIEATADDSEPVGSDRSDAIDVPVAYEPEPVLHSPAPPPTAGDEDEIAIEPANETLGLYDCLADARELAQAAQFTEERSRTALYAAVGRAYDVSLAAQDSPEDFAELLDESGLAMQDRAPMTPVVKLVFGADYDKTRLTEYAAALSYAHRIGIARGKLGNYLADAEGGLKGVVKEERRMRREEAGKTVEPRETPREALAKKLRAIEGIDLASIPAEGREFAVVVIRRTDDGEIVALGEIDDDIPLIERAARKIID